MNKYTAISLAAFIVLVVFAANAASAAASDSTNKSTCNVAGTNYECESWSDEQYPVIDLFGEKNVPLFNASENIWNSHTNKLARLILDSNETYTSKMMKNSTSAMDMLSKSSRSTLIVRKSGWNSLKMENMWRIRISQLMLGRITRHGMLSLTMFRVKTMLLL